MENENEIQKWTLMMTKQKTANKYGITDPLNSGFRAVHSRIFPILIKLVFNEKINER